MSVNVKYKNNSIAELTDTGTKTLKTAGKYCEADIVIENTKDGGTDAEDGIVARTIMTYTNNRVQFIGAYALCNCSKLTSVDFPAATTIGDSAFSSCSALTNVALPAAITIRSYAFSSCSNLTSIALPAATTIGSSAFSSCSKLTSVDFPAATTIGNSAFYGCSKLTSVDFPAATTIGNSAFYGCSKLTSVVLRKTDTICELSGTSVFNNTPIKSGTGYIYVPDALVDQYKAATNWSTYAANIKPLSEYTEV